MNVTIIPRLSQHCLQFLVSEMHAQFSLQALLQQSGLLPIPNQRTNPVSLNQLPYQQGLHRQPGLLNFPPQQRQQQPQQGFNFNLRQQQPGFNFNQQQQQRLRNPYQQQQLQYLQQQQTPGFNARLHRFENSSSFHPSSPPKPSFEQNSNQNTNQAIKTTFYPSASASSHTSKLGSSIVLNESGSRSKQDKSESSAATTAQKTSTQQRQGLVEGTSRLSPALEDNTEDDMDKQNKNRKGRKRPHTGGGGGNGGWAQQRPRMDAPAHTKPVHLPKGGYPQMSADIKQYYMKHSQTDDMFRKKMLLREALYAIFRGVFPYCGLYVTGSSMNGFGSSYSDMDLCLMLSNDKLDQKREATEILQVLQSSLRCCTFLKEIQFIRAIVPILKFTDIKSHVECDLNVNNPIGIRNTHLLFAYTKLDPRLAPLVVFVKHWAKFHNINDASAQTISSYSLALMVIHFLQCGVYPPVLPCLQQLYPDNFGSHIALQHLKLSNDSVPHYTSQNTLSSGELFLLFLRYYTQDINLEDTGISIRTGRAMKRRDLIINCGPPTQWKFLCIEEPYNQSNTARSVYCQWKWQRIMAVFRRSFTVLSKTGDMKQIVSTPF